MTKLRLLPTLVLAAAVVLPASAAMAQDEASAGSPASVATIVAADSQLAALEALVPSALAGLPLDENLQLATGEQLMNIMQPEEAAIMEDLLAQNGKAAADYVAATSWLSVSENDIVVIQAHRISGVDAAKTIDAWVEILSANLEDPGSEEDSISGRPVTLVSDATAPEVPLLHLFPAGDVMWMVVAADRAIVEEAMDAVGAEGTEEAEPAA